MRIILQKEVSNLGKVGDQMVVKPGFGRNYLIPQGMAVLASKKNIADFELRREELEKAAQQVLSEAKARASKLSELVVIIEGQAGDEGKLFGSIGPRDIAEAVNKAGVKVEKKEIIMLEGPIRQIGEWEVNVRLHSEVSVALKLRIVPLSRF